MTNSKSGSVDIQSKCWVCQSPDTRHYKQRDSRERLRPDDLQITDDRYGTTLALEQCQSCGFIFACGDELVELTSLYEQLDDIEYENTQASRTLQMRWLMRRILEQHPSASTLLDIGAGMGILVMAARDQGLEATGIEPGKSLVEAARQQGIDLIQGVFPHPNVSGMKFDIITLIDVIEHLADPVGLLQDCAEALAPGGLVVIVTPDIKSLPSKLLNQRWWHFRLAHVGYFNRHTLGLALARAGMKPTQWFRPKWFFPVYYLADRVAQYLPIRWFNRFAIRSRCLSWGYDRVVPVNLHDSWVVVARVDTVSKE